MKNLLISITSNYSYEQIYPWVVTAEKHCVNTDIVLFVNKNDRQTIKDITKFHKSIRIIPINLKFPCICAERFLHISNFIDNHLDKYSHVLMVDMRDAFFQSDPFFYIRSCQKDIIVNEEPIKYKNEPWGSNNFGRVFGEEIFEKYKDKTIYCAGVIGGKAKEFAELSRDIFYKSIVKPMTNADQAVMNYLFHTNNYANKVFFGNEITPFACHLGTQVGIHKDKFIKDNDLLSPIPSLSDNCLVNSKGVKFAIVHHYDRVPDWVNIFKTQFHK